MMSARQPIVLNALTSSLRSFRWITVLLFAVYLLSAVTIIQPGEVAMILRFGKLAGATRDARIHKPGLLFAWPYPIDRVIRVPIKEEVEVLIQDLWKPLADSGPALDTIDPLQEGYCLTGDQNILQTRMVAKYRIDDPIAYALFLRDPQLLVHDAVMAATSETIAGWRVEDVFRLRDDRLQRNLSTLVQETAQVKLNDVSSGIILSSVEFKEIHPPRHLRAEFERAQSARVEKETRRREAEGFAASQIPQAEAERNRLIKEALANATILKARATAEVSVFQTLHQEYRRDPTSTRERIYREATQQIMAQIGKRFLLPAQRSSHSVRIVVSESDGAP